MSRNQSIFFSQTTALLTIHVSLALAGARHIFTVIWWRRVKVWLYRVLNCELNLKVCRYGSGGIERRKS